MTDSASTHRWPTAADEPSPRRRTRWYLLGAFALLVGLYLTFFVAIGSTYTIPSDSMSPSYPPGTRIWASRFGTVERGEVVIFEHPDPQPGDPALLVKRVVAVGGDEVAVVDGMLVVNGDQVDEPYLAPGTTTVMPDGVTVPAGAVFLLGDHRGVSLDSRLYGPQPESTIVGYVRFSI